MDRNHVSPRRPSSREGDIATRPTASKQSSLATQPASESLKFSRRILDHVADAGPSQADKEKSCDTRRRPDEEDRQNLVVMSPQLIGKTVTPFLRDHIPGLYAPLAKSVTADAASQTPGANSRYCYRHRPDSKCRRAADESKMAMIQSELDLMTPADQQAITHVWSLFSAAPAKHRDLMLQGIVTQCCFPQLSRVAREVHEQLKIDFLSALPAEISSRILCYLDAISLTKAAQVSRQWRVLADQDIVWGRICEQHIDRKCTRCGFGLPLLERKRLRDWNRQRQLAESRQQEVASRARLPPSPPQLPTPSASKSPPPTKRSADETEEGVGAKRRCVATVENKTPEPTTTVTASQDRRFKGWKSVYKERFRVSFNWKWGRCKQRIFRGHTNGITCLQMDDNILATGSYDSTIRLWDIETGKEIRQLRGHTRGIRALKFDDKILVSGSLDGTVKIWDYHTGTLLNTLASHADGVISVELDQGYLASGSIDKTIKVFNLLTKELFTLKGHTDWVNSVRICTESRTLFSASDDCTVKLWDLESRQCIRTFEGHVGHVQQVLPLPYDFEPDDDLPGAAVDSTDTGSVASGRSSRGNTNHPPSLPALRQPPRVEANGNSVSASLCHQPPDETPRAAYGLRFQNDAGAPLPSRYILTGALDSTIRCWDTATGKCVRTFFGHLEGIWSLVGDTLRVVTGANDGMVKVWDPRSGKCERTFTGHRGPVTSVALSDSRLASGGEDGEVRLYSFIDMDGLEEWGTPS